MNKKCVSPIALVVSAALAGPAVAVSDVEIGVVLDGAYMSEARQWSLRDEGFGLGHSELVLSSNIDHNFRGQLVTVLGSHGGHTEVELEEAFIETTNLPAGLKVKAGRMLSNVGYMNSKHLHEDAFAERPAVYRAVFGAHYFDDGVQVTWLAPTDLYLQASVEAFSGKGWDVGYSEPAEIGVYTANLQVGNDVGLSNSWRIGASALYNGNGLGFAKEDGHDHSGHDHGSHDHAHDHSGHDHGHGDHGHSHGPTVTGRHIYGVDATWKWAPEGNYRQQNLRATTEFWLVDNRFDDLLETAPGADDTAQGWFAEVAYQFSPNWTISGRYGEVDAVTGEPTVHGDHFHGAFTRADIEETELALDFHPSHFGRLRAQVTHEQTEAKEQTIFVLQYVMSFGAHHAHAF